MLTHTFILNQLKKSWGSYGFKLDDILDAYRIDNENPRLLSLALKHRAHCKNGLFLQDNSGIATHILGLRLIETWQQGKILTRYKQVLWLPYSKLLDIPIEPPFTLEKLATLLNIDFSNEKKDSTLIIITGIDYLNHDKMQKNPNFVNLSKAWFSLIETMDWLAIGNHLPTDFKPNELLEIALPRLYLNLHYAILDSYDEERVSFPGELLVQEITDHTKRAFYFNPEQPNGVFSTSKTTVATYLRGKIDVVPENCEEIKHDQPLLTIQDVIKILSGTTGNTSYPLSMLDTCSKWYYAALSAEKIHQAHQNKKFYLYMVAGHIIARRMTQNSRNYVSDLGPLAAYNIHSLSNITSSSLPAIPRIIQIILSSKNFHTLDKSNILQALKNARKTWQMEASKRNETLEQKEEISPKNPMELSIEENNIFDSICRIFKNDLTDTELTQAINALPKESKDTSYQTLQKQVNHEFFESNSLQSPENRINLQILNILNGKQSTDISQALLLMISANIIAESARNENVFFALFAMLELMQQSEKKLSWQRFVALPERTQMNLKNADWINLIIADGLDALGGIHPMAHNGSFFQTQPTFSNGGKKPNRGITWPEFKTQILYMHWFINSLQKNGEGILLHHHTLSFRPDKEYRTLTPMDQRFIMREFELLARLEGTYNIKSEDPSIYAKLQQPFKQLSHLIADPKKICTVPCDLEHEFGFFLVIPKTGHNNEPQYIHLDSNRTLLIATKLEACNRIDEALSLYNYICKRHPSNIHFRFSRALLLMFHTDLIKNNDIRYKAQYDIHFLEKNETQKIIQPIPTVITQIMYLSAIYTLRVTLETEYPIKLTANILPHLHLDVIEKAEKIEDKFSQYDEEYPVLIMLIARAYQQAWLIQRNEPKDEYNIAASYSYFQQYRLYFIRFALTAHRTTDLIKNLNEFFEDMTLPEPMLVGIFAQGTTLNCTERKLISENKWPSSISIFVRFLLNIISLFKPYMNNQKTSIQDAIKDTKEKFKTQYEKHNFEDVTQDKLQPFVAKHQNKWVVLIKFNWQIPTSIIIAWAEHHKLTASLKADEEKGFCLYIQLNDNQSFEKRGDFQPTIHPSSFLITTFQYIDTKNELYFSKFSILFEDCLKQMSKWEPEERISYHLIGNQPTLPDLLLTRRNNGIQDILINLPNGVPIELILTWLRERNFAFHWVNDQTHGRCLCLTEINLDEKNHYFNEITSNGHLVNQLCSEYVKPSKSIIPDLEFTRTDLTTNLVIEQVHLNNSLLASIPIHFEYYISPLQQKEARAQLRTKARFDAIHQLKTTHGLISLPWDHIHHETISDGNCAFNAFALGLLYHKQHGIDLFTNHYEFKKIFAELFNYDFATFTADVFSQLVDALVSADINLDNPLIINIINKLKNVGPVKSGLESNQLKQRITLLKNKVLTEDAFDGDTIKDAYFQTAVKCLAIRGELFQVSMALALRLLCFRHRGDFTNTCLDAEGQFVSIPGTLNVSEKFGKYIGGTELSFLSRVFDIKIKEKIEEFGGFQTYGTGTTEIIVFYTNNPAPHYELILADNMGFLEGCLAMLPTPFQYISFFNKMKKPIPNDEAALVQQTHDQHYGLSTFS